MTIFIPSPDPEPDDTPLEIRMQIKSTDAFVKADPVMLFLMRTRRTRLESGGYRDELIDVANGVAQEFRLVPASDRAPEIRTSSGRSVLPQYTLVGVPSRDVKRNDTFGYGDNTYQCAYIRPQSTNWPYEIKADVVLVETKES